MEQVERTRRYLNKIRLIYSGVECHELIFDKEAHEDDVHSFFVHCYHIKDWIQQLAIKTPPKGALDEFINSHHEMKVCTDFCNGSKHCRLERKMRTGKQPHIAQRERRGTQTLSTPSGSLHINKMTFKIMTDQGCYDALELAEST